jgi:hypothetical protein
VLDSKHVVVWVTMLCDGTKAFGAGVTVIV